MIAVHIILAVRIAYRGGRAQTMEKRLLCVILRILKRVRRTVHSRDNRHSIEINNPEVEMESLEHWIYIVNKPCVT